MKTKVDKEGLLRKGKLYKQLNMQSFGHKMFISSQLYWCLWLEAPVKLCKVVKEYALIQKMSWRPLTMDSFGHKMFI